MLCWVPPPQSLCTCCHRWRIFPPPSFHLPLPVSFRSQSSHSRLSKVPPWTPRWEQSPIACCPVLVSLCIIIVALPTVIHVSLNQGPADSLVCQLGQDPGWSTSVFPELGTEPGTYKMPSDYYRVSEGWIHGFCLQAMGTIIVVGMIWPTSRIFPLVEWRRKPEAGPFYWGESTSVSSRGAYPYRCGVFSCAEVK